MYFYRNHFIYLIMHKCYFQLLFFICIYFGVKANNTTNYFRAYLENDTVVIGTNTQKKLYIIADSTAIIKQAKIKIIFPKCFSEFAWDNMFWLIIPPNQRAGYMQARSVSSGKNAIITNINLCQDVFLTTPSNLFDYKFSHENNQYIVSLEMLDTLPKGDTLRLTYGANGTNTYTFNTLVEQIDNFTILVDIQNNGNYKVVENQPQIYFKYDIANRVHLALSSKGIINQPELLKVAIHDKGKNVVRNFSGILQLTCSDSSAMSTQNILINPADEGKKDVFLTFNKNGVYTIKAKILSSNMPPINGQFTSNPININNDSINIYWGEFHTHTKFSRDGFGSDAYQYAKYGVGLDFYCGTDHADFNYIDTFGINPIEWKALQHETVTFDEPTRFVSFIGYENSLDNPYGHHNFIFNYNISNIYDVPMLTKYIYPNIQQSWNKLTSLNWQNKVLTIPHHTGKLFSLIGPDNGASKFGGIYQNDIYRKNIEIYSGHGQSEYYNPNHNLAYEKFGGRSTKFPSYAQNAWALGEKLSVIASTDSHNGRMAQSNAGITAVIADSLTRDKIFTSLYNRNTYGTTGERMILKFNIDKNIMGDEATIPCDSFPTIHFEVNGTDALDFVEILKWDFKSGTYSSNPVHPIYTSIRKQTFTAPTLNYAISIIDTTLRDSCLYYVRVKQKNLVSNREVWAWSSPIWINKVHCDTIFKTDSLYNFQLNENLPNIEVKWCMKDEFNSNYFVIERSSGDSTHFIALDTVQTLHVAFKDSCYIFIDDTPNDSILYYRIKIVEYTDSVKYSNILSVHIPFTTDSIWNLQIIPQTNAIQLNWNSREFFAKLYHAQKQNRTTNFFRYDSIAATGLENYSILDLMPLKDTSFYQIIMRLTNGSILYSNIDTLVFRIDSLFHFKTQIIDDSIVLDWKSEHEKEIIRYEIQRSQDKNLFYTIQTLTPQGNLFDTTAYSYSDTTYLVGWNYYRILLYMRDSSIKTSAIDSEYIVNTSIQNITNQPLEIKIVENIVHEGESYLNIITQSRQNTSGVFMIIGLDGKIYEKQNQRINNGTTFINLPIGYLSSGMYYLLFATENGIYKTNFIVTFHSGCLH